MYEFLGFTSTFYTTAVASGAFSVAFGAFFIVRLYATTEGAFGSLAKAEADLHEMARKLAKSASDEQELRLQVRAAKAMLAEAQEYRKHMQGVLEVPATLQRFSAL